MKMKVSLTELKECWQLIRPWWNSEERWVARGLFALVFLLDVALVLIFAWLTYWNRNFFNAFAAYDLDLVWRLMFEALLIGVCTITAEVSRTWFYQTLQMKWRKWVTDVYLQQWLNKGAFHRIENTQNIDNADQRIAEDLRNMCELSLHLSLGFLSNLINLATFSYIIWGISGTLDCTLFGWQIHIPGYMLWFSIAYAIISSIVLERWGRRMVAVEYEQQLRESDFRFQLMRIRENSAEIAISRGSDQERSRLKLLFDRIISNWEYYKRYTRRITFAEKGYTELGVLLAYFIIIPKYFARQIQLGSIMQLTMSFTKVRVGFAWFIFQYKRLATLRSICKRLSELYYLMNINVTQTINYSHNNGHSLIIDDLLLSLADGKVITKVNHLEIEPSSRWLIKGESGAGKTTLLKAISGIWPYGSGSISLPSGRMLFLPQQPYMPLGTLRTSLCYPDATTQYSEEQCRKVMILCGLKQFVSDLDADDISWHRKLSPGEKQRLAFAKCLLIRPDYLFMDEATSALDSKTEHSLFEALLNELPQTTIISVAHRQGLDSYHQHVLEM